MPFNSRPHKEVDAMDSVRTYGYEDLSIHDLTRRSTQGSDLTKNIAVFQFTTSQGGRQRRRFDIMKNEYLSIHDLTRRSTKTNAFNEAESQLSIHDLTRRSTLYRNASRQKEYFFQFTTSQGGRLLTRKISAQLRSFNSRPHKEVDV